MKFVSLHPSRPVRIGKSESVTGGDLAIPREHQLNARFGLANPNHAGGGFGNPPRAMWVLPGSDWQIRSMTGICISARKKPGFFSQTEEAFRSRKSRVSFYFISSHFTVKQFCKLFQTTRKAAPQLGKNRLSSASIKPVVKFIVLIQTVTA